MHHQKHPSSCLLGTADSVNGGVAAIIAAKCPALALAVADAREDIDQAGGVDVGLSSTEVVAARAELGVATSRDLADGRVMNGGESSGRCNSRGLEGIMLVYFAGVVWVIGTHREREGGEDGNGKDLSELHGDGWVLKFESELVEVEE